MKVNGINNIGGINKYNRHTESRLAPASKGNHKDELTISSEAKELLDTKSVSESTDSARVEQLKKQVTTGIYHVDANKIAEKLLPFLK